MEVLTSTRHMAMFQIVRNLPREAPVFELDEVSDQWPATGLRHTDCAVAVAEMVRDHLMTSYRSHSQRYVALTEAGLARYHDSEESLIRQVNDGLVLLRAKWRTNWLSLPKRRQRHRRVGDQAERPASDPPLH